MSDKRNSKNSEDVPESEQIFRYWVEIRDLRSGSTRDLPLTAVTRIYIPTERSASQRPGEEVLQLEGDSATLEANNLEDLATQLRQKYPDAAYEHTLRRERDRQAEQRRKDAMRELIKILAKAAVAQLVRKREGWN